VLSYRLVDEPTWPVNWGGRAISLDEIEEMARHSRSNATDLRWRSYLGDDRFAVPLPKWTSAIGA